MPYEIRIDKNIQPSESTLGIAARVWCTPKTEKFVLIPEVTEEFARIIDEYKEALMWCSGSADFGQGGKAEIGWKKICKPLLN